MTSKPQSEGKSLELEIARENRRFEISMFWQRANYFLVLNTALAVGAYSVSSIYLTLFLTLIGSLVSLLWFRTNTGAKFWQMFWEEEVSRLSQDLGIRALSESEKEIRNRARTWKVSSDSPWHKKFVHNRIINTKPEVSHNMILLSLLSFVAWLCVSLFAVGLIVLKFCVCMQ